MNDDTCQTCGAPVGEDHGESQSPESPYEWSNTCGEGTYGMTNAQAVATLTDDQVRHIAGTFTSPVQRDLDENEKEFCSLVHIRFAEMQMTGQDWLEHLLRTQDGD